MGRRACELLFAPSTTRQGSVSYRGLGEHGQKASGGASPPRSAFGRNPWFHVRRVRRVLFCSAQGSIHRALPFQERVGSRKVGPAGRQRLAGLAAPVFGLSARPSFSLAIRASSEKASRNGSVVSRAVRPSALIYRKSLALFLGLGRAALRPSPDAR